MLSSLFCYLLCSNRSRSRVRPTRRHRRAGGRAPRCAAATASAAGDTLRRARRRAAGRPTPPEAAPPPRRRRPPLDSTGASAQQNVRAPGSSLLNPALSLILDSSFGYYGRHAGRFAALGLPIRGDDPSDTQQGFGVQEIEIAAQRPSIRTWKARSS